MCKIKTIVSFTVKTIYGTLRMALWNYKKKPFVTIYELSLTF